MLPVHGSFQKPKADIAYSPINERHMSLGLSSPGVPLEVFSSKVCLYNREGRHNCRSFFSLCE